jgi:hypothetical protein
MRKRIERAIGATILCVFVSGSIIEVRKTTQNKASAARSYARATVDLADDGKMATSDVDAALQLYVEACERFEHLHPDAAMRRTCREDADLIRNAGAPEIPPWW